MKYTKRSLVGLFTLFIMPSGGAQAANNNAPYPFGDEFVYHTCPSGFDKQGLSCTKKITKPVLAKCDNGYNLSSDKQRCSKNISQSVTYSCPSGFRMQNNSCRGIITERSYSRSTSYVFHRDNPWNHRNSESFSYYIISWKGGKLTKDRINNLPYRHSDGWIYDKGASKGSSRYEVVRKKEGNKPRLSHCPSGYNKTGSSCNRILTKTVVKYCREGSLTNNHCLVTLSQSALRRSPIEEAMAALYPRYSNDTEQQQSAAFRYLDSM
ncbi:hypothetical protein AB4258_23495, partial [Vibrio splendidus]